VKEIKGIIYEDRGLSKIPIICLHGIGGDTTSFQPQLEDLSSGSRIIAWNMPGYGGSTPLNEVSFETLARKLRDFIIDLNIPAVHLCGQSIGGMLALEMAFVYPKLITS
jgi:3-oxoadipate enol-lactonase